MHISVTSAACTQSPLTAPLACIRSVEVQLAAVTALSNSLEFIKDNFSREGERNYIMQVVCEATQSSSSQVQVAAFECLVRIMQLYYDQMKFYMERALFGVSLSLAAPAINAVGSCC